MPTTAENYMNRPILIADPEESNREPLCEYLRDEGENVVLANDTRALVAALKGDPLPSLLITEWRFSLTNEAPGGTIIPVLEQIRDGLIPRLPIILYTSHYPSVQHTKAALGEHAGLVTAILMKPTSFDKVYETVRINKL